MKVAAVKAALVAPPLRRLTRRTLMKVVQLSKYRLPTREIMSARPSMDQALTILASKIARLSVPLLTLRGTIDQSAGSVRATKVNRKIHGPEHLASAAAVRMGRDHPLYFRSEHSKLLGEQRKQFALWLVSREASYCHTLRRVGSEFVPVRYYVFHPITRVGRSIRLSIACIPVWLHLS